MTEQERMKAFERQRKNAKLREMEADGTLEMERRIQREKRQREKLREEQRKRALKQRLVAMIVVIAIVVVVITVLFRSCGKKNKVPQASLPPQTSQEAVTDSIEADNEPTDGQETQQAATQSDPVTLPETQPQTMIEVPETQPQTVIETQAQPVESVAATVNSVDTTQRIIDPSGIVIPDWITVDLIHVNSVSRPAIALDAVHDIAIHYVANPGSSAKANRDYFDSLDNPAVEGAGRQASAHLIVGLEGEVVQCLPLNELAYAVRSRNPDTISIEVCHPDETGQFSDVTYNTLVKLTAWLLQQEHLTPDHVIRHFDCDGKACPLYYVEHEDAWNKLKQDIADYYYANPNIQ